MDTLAVDAHPRPPVMECVELEPWPHTSHFGSTSVLERGMPEDESRNEHQFYVTELRKGEVAVSLATVLARGNNGQEPRIDYRNQRIAYAMAQGRLPYYRLMEKEGHLRMLRDWRSFGDPSARLGKDRRKRSSFRVHPEHGGSGSNCISAASERMVERRFACSRSSSLRNQCVRAWHRIAQEV